VISENAIKTMQTTLGNFSHEAQLITYVTNLRVFLTHVWMYPYGGATDDYGQKRIASFVDNK